MRGISIRSNLAFLKLQNVSIFEQLQLEELLLRTSDQNICLINTGSSRAIVMGISGKAEELLNLEKLQKEQVPVIRRFSGGGTVIVDENTLFVTFIISEGVPIEYFPEPILRFGEEIFRKSLSIDGFRLLENDYCIKERKCAGNAQYIQRGRFLLHTSFLWDYQESNMDYLLMPKKRPLYRRSRGHTDFLCKLKHYALSKEWIFESIEKELKTHFEVSPLSLSEIILKPYRQTVVQLQPVLSEKPSND
jgi:lipoate-protein ligase A